MIYPANLEKKIGFDTVRQLLLSNCLFELGRKRVEEMSFCASFDEVIIQLKLTNEFLNLILLKGRFPIDNYIDLSEVLQSVRLEGTHLDVQNLFSLKCSLDTLSDIVKYLKKLDANEYPEFKKEVSEILIPDHVLSKANQIINNEGEIKDNASKDLSEIRNRIKSKRSSVNKSMQAILRKAQKDGIVSNDVSVSIRDGKMLIPVDASKKRSIKGYVYDESATGKTSFIEPAEIIELNNVIRELEFSELREIHKILILYTNDIRPYIDDLLTAYDFMGFVDFVRAKALFSQKIKAVLPKVFNEQIINMRQARHPVLYLSHLNEKKEIVPLNINLDSEQRILLISGPNAGGKSVCLKTVGILQYMLQCGLLVPALENSEFGIFNDIFIDIGDEQSIENDLSTYSSHLLNMKHFVKNARRKSLLLIDEFGTGTEPEIGGAIAESILQKLNENKAMGVITTHYSNLKHYASATDGIENAAMLFDHQKMQPAYILSIGKPGSSFAFEIARKIGLSEDILKNASSKVGEGYVSFDKHLRDIQRDKKYWENKRARIRRSEKKLESVINKYNKELESSKDIRKEIIDNAKKQAEEILSDVNKVIEGTIREIKESNAEKEKTKQARIKVEEVKNAVKDKDKYIDKQIEQKIKKLREREQALKMQQPEPINKKQPEIVIERDIVIGDKVKLINQDTCGEVLDIQGSNFIVAFGNMQTILKKERLEILSNNEYKRNEKNKSKVSVKYDMSEKRLKFSPNIDVRGARVEEVIPRITDFIDSAIMVNSSRLRILHGKGNGVLRNVIRNYLKTVPEVKSFADEHIEMGGSGITVVNLA